MDGNKIMLFVVSKKNIQVKNIISEIPQIFRNQKTGDLLNTCIMCDDNLLDYEHGYLIEKAFKKNVQKNEFELIFEYAICTECQQSMSKEMSEKSMKNIQLYFNKYKARISKLSNSKNDIDLRLTNCMIKEENVDGMQEYQIAGQFYKTNMIVFDAFPFAIGEIAIGEIQELLSKKTRDFSEKFKDLILPPSVRDKIPDNRPVYF